MNRINRNIFMFKDNHNCLECYRVFRRITCARGRPTGTDSCTRLWSTSTRWDWRHSMRTSRKSRWNWPTGNKHFWVRWERRVLSWHGIEDLSLKSENLYLKYYRERMLFCKRKKSWFEKPFTCNIFYAVQNFLCYLMNLSDNSNCSSVLLLRRSKPSIFERWSDSSVSLTTSKEWEMIPPTWYFLPSSTEMLKDSSPVTGKLTLCSRDWKLLNISSR